MSIWAKTTIGAVLPFRYGKGLPQRMRTHLGKFHVVSSAGVIDQHDEALTHGSTVVIGRKGSIGTVYYCPDPVFPIDTTFFVEGSDRVDSRFAFYLLSSLPLSQMNNDSAVPGLNRAQAENLEILLPPIEEQRSIAATLGSLDDKIESNRRAIKLVEQLFGMEFQKLLGTESVDFQPLSRLISITKGVSYKSADLQPSRTSLVTLKSFDRNGGYKVDGLKPYVGPYKAQQVVEPGEVVVAQTDLTQGAEVVGRAVRVPYDSSADILVASLDLVIVRPSAEITLEYLLGVLINESFRDYCRSRTSGTTVLHLASDAIPSYMAPIVPASIQQRFSSLSRPLIARADSLNIEIAKLASLRDTLLPELLSGRISVPEARDAVQGAVT